MGVCYFNNTLGYLSFFLPNSHLLSVRLINCVTPAMKTKMPYIYTYNSPKLRLVTKMKVFLENTVFHGRISQHSFHLPDCSSPERHATQQPLSESASGGYGGRSKSTNFVIKRTQQAGLRQF